MVYRAEASAPSLTGSSGRMQARPKGGVRTATVRGDRGSVLNRGSVERRAEIDGPVSRRRVVALWSRYTTEPADKQPLCQVRKGGAGAECAIGGSRSKTRPIRR